MAFDKGCVVGVITDIIQRDKFDIVVVHDGSRPQWPNDVACEFSGKSRELVRDLAIGQWVTVEGSIRSKCSEKTGHWFTNFVCYSVGQVQVGSKPAKGGGQHREVRGNEKQKQLDDDIPF